MKYTFLTSEIIQESNLLINTFRGTSNVDYSQNWDNLMAVVHKIRSVTSRDRDLFSTKVTIDSRRTYIESGSYGGKTHGKNYFIRAYTGKYNTTEATFRAVSAYIKWYNLKFGT